MSCLHPASPKIAKIASASTIGLAATRPPVRSVLNIRNLIGSDTLEEPARLSQVKQRVFRFDTQEEVRAGCQLKTRSVENRMVRHRQSVQPKHSKDSSKCSEEHCHFKNNGYHQWPADHRA